VLALTPPPAEPALTGPLSEVHVFVANGEGLKGRLKAMGAVFDAQYLRNVTTHVFAEKQDFRLKNLLKSFPNIKVLDQSWFNSN